MVVVAPGRERQRRGTARRRRRRGGPGQSKLFTLKRLHFNIGPKPRDKRRARCLSPSCFRFAPRCCCYCCCCCCCCCCWLPAAALVPLSAACRLNSLFLSCSAPSLSLSFSLHSVLLSLLLLLYPIFFSILALSFNSGGTTVKNTGKYREITTS